MPATAPFGRAGELFEVSDGGRSVVVTEEGAGLHQVDWDGAKLLHTATDDGFGDFGCHGQILAPWPGRVAGGTYSYEGESYRLPVDDPVHHASLHGFARWLSWSPAAHTAGSMTFTARMLGRTGYPFCFDLEQSYTWAPDRLLLSFRAVNIGQRTAPFGYGCHPYFTAGLPTVDAGMLQVPADQYLEADDDLSPVGPAKPVEGTSYDLRHGRPVGTYHWDTTLTGLVRGDGGDVAVSFASPGGGATVTCHFGPAVNYVQIYSGDTLAPSLRRRGLAIEPYTCAPNAFNNGHGLLHVAPGGSVSVTWAISASALP